MPKAAFPSPSTAALIEPLEPRVLFSAVQAQTADSFVDSIGINIKLDRSAYQGTGFTGTVVPALEDLGIRHQRDGLKLVENATYRARYQQLYDDAGIDMLAVWGPFEDPDGTPDRAPGVAALGSDFIEVVGGPNEPDVFDQPSYNGLVDDRTTADGDPIDYAASRAYQNDLYDEIKADPATDDLPVLTPAMAFPESVRYITPANHDTIAAHRYTGFARATNGINNWLSRTREWNGDQPIWITEAGHVTTPNLNTAQSVSERAQGVYLPRLLTEYFARGIERTYVHQLLDIFQSNTNDSGNWGLIRSDGTFKPSYHAIDNLIDTLSEGVWNPTTKKWETPEFTPDVVDVTYTKSNNQIRTPLLLQKSDGTLYFLTFRDVDVFDGLTNDGDGKHDITWGEINLTMDFVKDVDSFTHYRFNDNGELIDAGGTLSNADQRLVLGISDELSIIEVRFTDAGTTGVYLQDSGADGVVSIEAENYSDAEGGTTDMWGLRVGGSGGGHLEAGPDSGDTLNTGYVGTAPRVDFEVEFTKTGTHYVWIRGKAGGTGVGGSDSLHVGFNGQAVSTADRISGFGSGFGWIDDTMDNSRARINVTSTGVHTVSVWMREDGFDFDKIVLTTSSTYNPSTVNGGLGPAESTRVGASETRQAESGTIGGGATVESGSGGFNGSGYVNFNTSGGYVDFTGIAGGRTVDLTFRYALGAAGTRTADLKINGSTVQTVTLTSTGSWSTWGTHTETVTLPAGTATARVQSTGQDWGNLDQLQITDVATAPLVHQYGFDGNADDSVGSANGTLTNGASLTTNAKVGSQALRLDGSNDYVGTGTLAEGNAFTIAGWVYVNGGESNIQGILSNKSGGASGYFFRINSFQTSDGRLILETGNGSTSNSAFSTTGAVSTGQWNHLAAVVDRTAGTARLYVNGVDVTEDSTIVDDFKVNATARIGSKGDGAFVLGGRIDDLRVYGGQLSAAEVSDLYDENATSPAALSLTGATITSYNGTQDAGSATIVNNTTIQLTGNSWKKIDFGYTVTADTMLAFEFRSTSQGEVQGIGLDSDDDTATGPNSNFQLYGTQSLPSNMIGNYDTYSGSDWTTYVIPVGQFFTGVMNYLTFINDDDVDGSGVSDFRNIRVYEA